MFHVKQSPQKSNQICNIFTQTSPYSKLKATIFSNESISVSGINSTSQLSVLTATLLSDIGSPLIVAFHDAPEMENFLCDLEAFIPTDHIAIIPDQNTATDSIPGNSINNYLLNNALNKIITNKVKIIIILVTHLKFLFPAPMIIESLFCI